MSRRIIEGQLEIDDKLGIVYFHPSDSQIVKDYGIQTIMRISGMPRPLANKKIDIAFGPDGRGILNSP